MALMTMIARTVDGLPLVGTMQESEEVSSSAVERVNFHLPSTFFTCTLHLVWQECFGVPKPGQDAVSQARTQLASQMHVGDRPVSVPVRKIRFAILIRIHEMGLLPFSYLIENEVCYLVLCDKLFSKRIAFNFLEDLAQEFHTNYGRKVNTVTRPYQFIEFDIYIQKAKKSLTDRRRNINTINNQLQDVQRIMVQNIDDVLQRGAVLSELDTKTQNLSLLSQKYKKSATQLNRRSMYVKAAIGGIILLVLGMYFWVF